VNKALPLHHHVVYQAGNRPAISLEFEENAQTEREGKYILLFLEIPKYRNNAMQDKPSEVFVPKKLALSVHSFSHFDTILACDRHRDGQ